MLLIIFSTFAQTSTMWSYCAGFAVICCAIYQIFKPSGIWNDYGESISDLAQLRHLSDEKIVQLRKYVYLDRFFMFIGIFVCSIYICQSYIFESDIYSSVLPGQKSLSVVNATCVVIAINAFLIYIFNYTSFEFIRVTAVILFYIIYSILAYIIVCMVWCNRLLLYQTIYYFAENLEKIYYGNFFTNDLNMGYH